MYEIQFIQSLIVTICTETLLLFAVVRRLLKIEVETISNRSILFGGFTSSAATLPYIWFVIPAFIESYAVYTITAESFAVFAEAGFYKIIFKISPRRAFFISFICNAGSYTLAKVLQQGGLL